MSKFSRQGGSNVRMTPVYNASLLSFIKRHDGITKDFIIENYSPITNRKLLDDDLGTLLGMNKIELKDGKYY